MSGEQALVWHIWQQPADLEALVETMADRLDQVGVSVRVCFTLRFGCRFKMLQYGRGRNGQDSIYWGSKFKGTRGFTDEHLK